MGIFVQVKALKTRVDEADFFQQQHVRFRHNLNSIFPPLVAGTSRAMRRRRRRYAPDWPCGRGTDSLTTSRPNSEYGS